MPRAKVSAKKTTRAKTTLNAQPKTAAKKKEKTQVRRNKDAGSIFENKMFAYFSKYLKDRKITGIVYKFPESNYNQIIDLMIDSADFGYVGVECKSIKDTVKANGKIYFSRISSIHKRNGKPQFVNQHTFLKVSGRFGVIAFEFRDIGITILIPHQYIYEKIANGESHITVSEIIENGFDILNTEASLKLFIHKSCKSK